MRRFEFVEGTSSKFWEITLDGSSFTVRYGKIGAAGQTQVKSWPSEEKAKTEHDKLVKEKVGKGYVELDAAPSDAAAEPTPTPAAAPAPKQPPKPKPAPIVEAVPPGDGWIELGEYGVGLRDGKVVARNKQGKVLSSVPKQLKEHEVVAQLEEAAEWLEQHEAECLATIEAWMLRSLPVPTAVVQAVWADPAWRGPLENAVVRAVDADGAPVGEAGLLRGVEASRGVGVVTLDGETIWLKAENFSIPHPILLGAELDEWRGMLAHLGLKQALSQLFRETFPRPDKPEGQNVREFSGGDFAMLNQAFNEARKRGYRVSGGCAVCRVWEGGQPVEARYWLGEGDPMYETTTGDLWWVDARQRTLELAAVTPVAWSEGMRMASAIHAKRKVEQKEGEDV